MMSIASILFAAVSAAGPVEAATRPAGLPQGDPRRNVEIQLVLDKDEYLIGENVLLHYGAINRGSEEVPVSFGGDYRGCTRPLRFKVEAYDSHGKLLEDPFPSQMCFGGLGTQPKLKPGEGFWCSLPLTRYREFDRDGEYRIRVWHDLGWEPEGAAAMAPADANKAPVAEIAVRFRIPSQKEASELVQRTLKMPRFTGGTFGKRNDAYPDFTTFRHAVYLPILKELAAKGEPNAMPALGAMATPEATRTLIEMAASTSPFAASAERYITQRLPLAKMEGEWHAERRRMVRLAWREEFGPSARSLALSMIQDPNQRGDRFRNGCAAIRAIGRKEDLPRLVKILDRILAATKNDPAERQNPPPWTPTAALAEECRELVVAGGLAPATPASAGEAYVFLVALRDQKEFRPDGWQQTLAGLLKHEAPLIRATAAGSIPDGPLHELWARPLKEMLERDCSLVQAHACWAAFRTKDAGMVEPLRKLARTHANEFLFGSATDALIACGVPRDKALQVVIDRLDEPAVAMHALNFLLGHVVQVGSWGSSGVDWAKAGPDLKREWTAFVATNRDAVREGRKFAPGKEPLRVEMFPRGFSLAMPDKTQWPAWR